MCVHSRSPEKSEAPRPAGAAQRSGLSAARMVRRRGERGSLPETHYTFRGEWAVSGHEWSSCVRPPLQVTGLLVRKQHERFLLVSDRTGHHIRSSGCGPWPATWSSDDGCRASSCSHEPLALLIFLGREAPLAPRSCAATSGMRLGNVESERDLEPPCRGGSRRAGAGPAPWRDVRREPSGRAARARGACCGQLLGRGELVPAFCCRLHQGGGLTPDSLHSRQWLAALWLRSLE